MKNLHNFKTFEAVIMPIIPLNNSQIRNMSDLKKYGEENDFDVVNYDEFYDSLSDENKKTAPPRMGPAPFFALFHPTRKKPMFVMNNEMMMRMPNFKEIVDDIIGHERIHGEQNLRRKGLTFNLPNPNDQKNYFNDEDEIMAFSWSIAQDISKSSSSFEEAIKKLDTRTSAMWTRLWDDIKRVSDSSTLNKYRKNIYNYLKKMYETS